jgi:hypothetical protein
MNPMRFERSNTVMRRPESMTEEQCFDVHAFIGQDIDGMPVVITKWQPTAEERTRLALGEPVWLHIIGHTMPPVAITMDDPFSKTQEAAP